MIVELLKLNIAAGRGQFQVSVTDRLTQGAASLV
jgi:hypothetical protein